MNRFKNKSAAVVVGLLASAAVAAGLLALLNPLSNDSAAVAIVFSFFASFFVYFWFAAMAALLLGGPAFLLLRRLATVSRLTLSIAGSLIVLITPVIVLFPNSPPVDLALECGLVGIVSALMFYKVWSNSNETRR